MSVDCDDLLLNIRLKYLLHTTVWLYLLNYSPKWWPTMSVDCDDLWLGIPLKYLAPTTVWFYLFIYSPKWWPTMSVDCDDLLLDIPLQYLAPTTVWFHQLLPNKRIRNEISNELAASDTRIRHHEAVQIGQRIPSGKAERPINSVVCNLSVAAAFHMVAKQDE